MRGVRARSRGTRSLPGMRSPSAVWCRSTPDKCSDEAPGRRDAAYEIDIKDRTSDPFLIIIRPFYPKLSRNTACTLPPCDGGAPVYREDHGPGACSKRIARGVLQGAG